jgi:hypothetical protein
MAAKLALLVYRMLRYGLKYVDQGAERYETQYGKQQVSYLKRRAAQCSWNGKNRGRRWLTLSVRQPRIPRTKSAGTDWLRFRERSTIQPNRKKR